MYHEPYKNGYSVLPQLKKLGDRPIFEIDANFDHYLREKQLALKEQYCWVEKEYSPLVDVTIARFVAENYPGPLNQPCSLFNIGPQIQEDLAVHCIDGERDWMAAGHICFPSGWKPEDKVGRDFEQIHWPIPGMDLRSAHKMARSMVHSGPFERFVWGIVFENRINGHPQTPKKKFDPEAPVLYVKVERQITVGFPSVNAALFVIRQFLIEERDIDKPALLASLEKMTPDQIAYKGITKSYDSVLAYLRSPLSAS